VWAKWRAPILAALVSKLLAFQDILVFAVASDFGRGAITNWHTLFGDVLSPSFWFGLTMSLVFGAGPYYRAGRAVTATQTCPNCGEAVKVGT
jgi:hypothetical protein